MLHTCPCTKIHCFCVFHNELLHFCSSVCLIVMRGSTVRPLYKGHLSKPENVPFMSSCPLYTG